MILVLLLASAPASGGTAEAPRDDEAPLGARTALLEGNRLFRASRLEAAVATYRRGVGDDGGIDPVLAYNLGTSLHQLGRLPEALLWYRRARAAGSRDPWLEENLERLRTDLGAAHRPPPRLLAPLLLHPRLSTILAAGLAWAALLAATVAPSRWRRAVAPLLVAAFVAWIGGEGLRRLGPRPVVLLSGCGPGLPAGSEAWGVPDPSGSFRLVGGREVCPAETVSPVAPAGR